MYEGLGVQKPVPATLVDKGQGPYILNFEQVFITPKPPWPVVYLEVDSANGNFNSQMRFNCWLWVNCGWVTGQLRPP